MKIIARLALLVWFNSADAQVFQYIYIEANEGSSSGGHVAVQFEDEIFHYQYTGNLTRLAKEDAENFRFDYRFLQNRTLHVADIEVSEQTFTQLQTHFKRQYWDQDRQFKHLETLESDRLLLEWLLALKYGGESVAAPKSLDLPGAGLFYANSGANIKGECDTSTAASAMLNQLRENIEHQDKDFLNQRSKSLELAIRQLIPENSNNDYGFSQRYTDLLNGLFALRVIVESRHLNPDACYSLHEPEWRLDIDKIQVLKNYQQRLLKSAESLLHSNRPDWGHALFTTLARLLVVEQSLQSGQWTFLDDFDSEAVIISTKDYSHQAHEMRLLRLAAEQQWQRKWQALTNDHSLDDIGYAGLELAANRFQEWESSVHRHTLRYKGQKPLPDKAFALSSREVIPELSEPQLLQALSELQSSVPKLSSKIENQYAYNLISRNCVTEIFRSMNQALGDETEQRLGSKIDPDLNFIPFAAFAYLQSHYPVTDTTMLPSFRQQALARQYDQEFAPWVYARESNVLSAELYHYNPDDAPFLFFTDDGILLRPLFGAFNTLTGIGQSLLGIIQLPVDQGTSLHNGARGLMMSLPELAFINIRKGSYKFDFSVNLSAEASTSH